MSLFRYAAISICRSFERLPSKSVVICLGSISMRNRYIHEEVNKQKQGRRNMSIYQYLSLYVRSSSYSYSSSWFLDQCWTLHPTSGPILNGPLTLLHLSYFV